MHQFAIHPSEIAKIMFLNFSIDRIAAVCRSYEQKYSAVTRYWFPEKIWDNILIKNCTCSNLMWNKTSTKNSEHIDSMPDSYRNFLKSNNKLTYFSSFINEQRWTVFSKLKWIQSISPRLWNVFHSIQCFTKEFKPGSPALTKIAQTSILRLRTKFCAAEWVKSRTVRFEHVLILEIRPNDGTCVHLKLLNKLEKRKFSRLLFVQNS